MSIRIDQTEDFLSTNLGTGSLDTSTLSTQVLVGRDGLDGEAVSPELENEVRAGVRLVSSSASDVARCISVEELIVSSHKADDAAETWNRYHC